MADSSPAPSVEIEREGSLLSKDTMPIRPKEKPPRSAAFHLAVLYFALAIQVIALFVMAYRLEQVNGSCTRDDQSVMGVYCKFDSMASVKETSPG